MEEDFQPVVFDLGSSVVKAGYIDEIQPRAEYTSVVGYPRHRGIMVGMGQKDCYVGDEALSKCGILPLAYPIQRGLISHWYYAEKMWYHTFYNEVRVAPEEQNLIMLEHPLTPKDTREKIAQIMFGTFTVPALFFANPAAASLRAVGRTSGVVLCSGGQTTYSMAVKDGKGIMSTLNSLDMGGEDIAGNATKALASKHEGWFTTSAERAIVGDMLRKYGYVALDYDSELQRPQNEVLVEYECPDGTIFNLYHDRFSANEIMFKPDMYGIEKDGIHNMIQSSVMKCDADIHATLLNNIVLSGGNTLLRGLDARLIKELKVLFPQHAEQVRIDTILDRQYLPFRGAARLAPILTANHGWIRKEEYDEVGPSLIQSKCPIGAL